MTETTATRLAAAIVDARAKLKTETRHLMHAHVEVCRIHSDETLAERARCWDVYDAALARLERLCVASGRWEEHQALHAGGVTEIGPCTTEMAISALLREET